MIWKFRGCRVEKFFKGWRKNEGERSKYKKKKEDGARIGRLRRMEEQCKPWNWTGCLQHLRLRRCCGSYIELYTAATREPERRKLFRSRVCTRNFYDKSSRRAMSFKTIQNPEVSRCCGDLIVIIKIASFAATFSIDVKKKKKKKPTKRMPESAFWSKPLIRHFSRFNTRVTIPKRPKDETFFRRGKRQDPIKFRSI